VPVHQVSNYLEFNKEDDDDTKIEGRGLHSSTSELNLSRFSHKNIP